MKCYFISTIVIILTFSSSVISAQDSSEYSFSLKVPIHDSLDFVGFFTLKIDTTDSKCKIINAKPEFYKVYQDGNLFCQELGRSSDDRCGKIIKKNMKKIICKIQKKQNLIDIETLRKEGLRISKPYRILLLPDA